MKTSSIPHARLTDDAALRLVCLPHAGGGSAVFHHWRPMLPVHIDLVPACLPGHDGRLAETPRTDLRALASELADDVAPALDRPYAVVGHSLGAWIAFELARELRRQNLLLPRLLIVTAARPPDTASPDSPLHLLPDDEFIAAIARRYDGIPPAVVDNTELLQLLLPVLRADFQMGETYRYCPEPPLDIEILALGGADDPAVSAPQLAEWSRHTTQPCSVRLFPGGHFFLFQTGDRSSGSVTIDRPSPALRAIIDSIESAVQDIQHDKKSASAET